MFNLAHISTHFLFPTLPFLGSQFLKFPILLISISALGTSLSVLSKLASASIFAQTPLCWGFPGGSDGKASAYNVGDPGSIPGLRRSSGEGNGNPLQYSCLENPMDRGAW